MGWSFCSGGVEETRGVNGGRICSFTGGGATGGVERGSVIILGIDLRGWGIVTVGVGMDMDFCGDGAGEEDGVGVGAGLGKDDAVKGVDGGGGVVRMIRGSGGADSWICS